MRLPRPHYDKALGSHLRRRGGGNSVKKLRSWKRPFHEPIPLPRGRQLVTLDEDAGNYITKLPKAEHTAAEWQ
jgi:hypothetical protein